MNYKISFFTFSDNTYKKCIELFKNTFPKNNIFSVKYLKWLYEENPYGSVVSYNAFDKDKLIAHYACIPIKAKIKGKIYNGLLSLNTATNPNYQGKGLFTELAKKTYKFGLNNGYDFVIGVANKNSVYGFINKLDFNKICTLEARIGLGKLKINDKNIYDFEIYKSSEMIEWRLKNPSAFYFKGKENLIYAKSQFYFIDVIMTLSVNKININLPKKNEFLKLYIGINPYINWNKSFYFNIPLKLRPSPLYLIFKKLNKNLPEINWHKAKFETIDFDAF